MAGSLIAGAPPIRIVSWNVHGSVGPDRRCDPDRVLDVVRSLAPDILALQEIDGRTHLGRRARAFETFAEALGDHRVEARTVQRPDRDYGHLLWSRWPLASADVRELPGGAIEPRAAIDAMVATPAGRLRVLAAHFGLFPRDRRRQAASLGSWAGNTEIPTIALGDFNEWRREGPAHRALSASLPVRVDAPSWPARRPFFALDRLYASQGIAGLRRVEPSPSIAKAAALASDHLPLVVDLSLP